MAAALATNNRWIKLTQLTRSTIGVRLGLCFLALAVLMLAGGGFSLWQIHRLETRIHRLNNLDSAVFDTLQADNMMARFAEQLRAAIVARDVAIYRATGDQIQRETSTRIDRTLTAVRNASDLPSDTKIFTMLSYWRQMVPDYIRRTTRMAALGDWPAVERRHNRQLVDVASRFDHFIAELESQINRQREALVAQMGQAERQASLALLGFGGFTLLAAVALGYSVTRSITGPLGPLTEAARSLASGNFSYRVAISGDDELATLGQAFNCASSSLRELYQTVQHKEAHFRSVFENVADPILVLGLDGKIVSATPSSALAFGFPPDELKGRHLSEMIVPEDWPAIAAHLKQQSEPIAPPAPAEVRWRRKDGSWHIFETTLSDLRSDPSIRGFVVNTHDITERIAGEMRIRELNEHLEKRVAERTAQLASAKRIAEEANIAKSQFLANMSHEIRTPMNGILGFTELALQSTSLEEQKDCLTTIRSSGDALLTILNDLLDLSKIESGKFEIENAPFSLRDLISDAGKVFAFRMKEKNLHFTSSVAEDLPDLLLGDALRLRQVLLNLLGNAVKFTHAGGVSLDATGEHAAHQVHLRLAVRDSGIGIPPEKQARVFEAFRQADDSTARRYGGTGLGLSICVKLVALMGGKIELQSQLGQGSTFSIVVSLPVSQSRRAVERDPVESSPSDLKPMNILLAEDNPVNQKLAVKLLEKQGHRVTVAANGRLAVQQFEQGSFDLILMDVQMPEMDGLEATREIRRIKKAGNTRVPIIAMTAQTMTGDRENCFAAGMDGFVSKPLRLPDLWSAIQAAQSPA